jgi:hypothetical protein
MATLDVFVSHDREGKLSVLRCTLTGAAVLLVQFAICWAAAAAGLINSSHMYISLFTLAPVASPGALVVGLFWSTVFGALTGALVAIAYNAFAFVARR